MGMFEQLQKIGKALMLPIAVLPAAALLLRIGVLLSSDLKVADGTALTVVWNVMTIAGDAVFGNLALLFAIGVAVGLTEGAGVAALGAAVGYQILAKINGVGSLIDVLNKVEAPAKVNMSVFGGILIGVIAAWAYNNYKDMKHILNTFVWFQLGSFTKADGTVVTGDLNRFFAGDPTAGPFMAGWFVVMMFGLPAAAYAIYQAADKSEKKSTGSIMGSAGFTSFLTGITEPIEFSFAYAAPVLFAIHGLLAGVALAICAQLDWVQGFGFSAGLIDYLLNFTLASAASTGGSTGPLGILGLGVVFAAIYYVLFAAAIRTQNLATPGRTPVKAKGRR